MCGLVFVYDDSRDPRQLQGAAEAATEAIRHRGPDEGGVMLAAGAVLGSRRLSIIDLASSHQPMASADGVHVLAYNGEIYNYRERRSAYAGRWTFATSGDTELLLAALALDGPQALEQFEGMWAFAFWDTRTRTVILGRDRMGKKPLYYRVDGRALAAASELPALSVLKPEARWDEDLDSAADYLRYGFPLPGHTAYRGVAEVPPGHVVRWSPDGGAAASPYWRLPLETFPGNQRDAAVAVRAALTQAVRGRLVADVEVGAWLSGGIDSSTVVGLLTREAAVKPKTFTIGFADASYDERAFARTVAEHFGTMHFEEILDTLDPMELSRLVLHHVGQPFGDPSLLPTALVSRLAARHVKVVLSGDGGDELFGGYQRYVGRSLLRWYTRLPGALRRAAAGAIRALPEPGMHHSRSLLKKAHLFLDAVDRSATGAPYVAPTFYTTAEFAELAPGLAGHGHAPALPHETGMDDLQQMMVADALVYLPQDILLKVDRMSMAYSLEARAPFLDTRLVRLAFSLPAAWHLGSTGGKRVLRDAIGDLLPPSILRRRKQGFAVPVHAWFRGALGDRFADMIARAPVWLAQQELSEMLAEHRNGARDHGLRLWALFVYLLWRERGARPA